MTTVYVVTEGTYSDYHIICICSTREKAQMVHDAIGTRNDVEEFVLDDYADPIDHGLLFYEIVMMRDGNKASADKFVPFEHTFPLWEIWHKYVYANGDIYPSRLHGYCWARDEEHAVKIANEKRAQMIASGEWPPD